MDKVYLIGEVGPNHNGSVETALTMIEKMAEAGVDCVKFQMTDPYLLAKCPWATSSSVRHTSLYSRSVKSVGWIMYVRHSTSKVCSISMSISTCLTTRLHRVKFSLSIWLTTSVSGISLSFSLLVWLHTRRLRRHLHCSIVTRRRTLPFCIASPTILPSTRKSTFAICSLLGRSSVARSVSQIIP